MCFDVEDRKINITANPDPICQQGTGSISPTVTGGTEPYNFEWSNGETTQEIFDLPLGTYYLLVEDANGCWGNAEFEVN
ncbi:MAG: SprB repeat-containing protein [Saprospiraceae bacterium]|nr:SprB repeat-containing protein [Saprospiraceae bacterium]